MAKKDEAKIMIDDKQYLVSELSDKVKAEIQSLQFCESEIVRLNAQLAVAGTAKIAYRKAVAKLLAKDDVKH